MLFLGSTYKFRVVAVYMDNDNQQGPTSRRFVIGQEIDVVPNPNTPIDPAVIVKVQPVGPRSLSLLWRVSHLHMNIISTVLSGDNSKVKIASYFKFVLEFFSNNKNTFV